MSRYRRWQLARALNGTHGMADAATTTGLLAAWNAPVGVWIKGKMDVRGLSSDRTTHAPSATAEAALSDAAAQSAPRPLVVLVLHALPNRDCRRVAPKSEACCHYASEAASSSAAASCDYHRDASSDDSSTCEVGLAEYKADIVDPLADLLAEYTERVRIALVLEPGSLASLALGSSASACAGAATQHAYLAGLTLAIDAISTRAPRVSLYLDAGDGSQLGWGERARDYVIQVAQLGSLVYRLRGFATNVGGYQPLGAACPAEHATSLPTYCRLNAHAPCCASDPCGLRARFNAGVGELNYVQLLARHVDIALPGLKPHFLVDTGRNGVERSRIDCDATCNLRGAGFGVLPSAETALPGVVDAYLWLHPPGVSDGCAASAAGQRNPLVGCRHSEPSCARDDALGARPLEEAAPGQGRLYVAHLRRLAAQAVGVEVYMSASQLNGNGRGTASKLNPKLAQAASDAATFAAQLGVPTGWASGLVAPEPTHSTHDDAVEGWLTAPTIGLVAVIGVVAAIVAARRGKRPDALHRPLRVANVDESTRRRGGEAKTSAVEAVALVASISVDEEDADELAVPDLSAAPLSAPKAASSSSQAAADSARPDIVGEAEDVFPTEFRCVE